MRERSQVELFLFPADPDRVAEAARAGVDGFVVDRRTGLTGQHTLRELMVVRAATTAPVLCRLSGFGPWTTVEVDLAIDAGVDELLLPTVRAISEVDRVLELIGGRCRLGVCVDNLAAVRLTGALAARPLSRVYLDLSQLRLERGSASVFEPLVDGTADAVRGAVGQVPFGIAGLTVPGRPERIPTDLLATELVRLDAGFTFLRRSFCADTAGVPMAPAIAAIHHDLLLRAGRSAGERLRDRGALLRSVRTPVAA